VGDNPVRNAYPSRAPNLASRVLDGEAIIMNPADSTLFNLNETATVIWLAADGTRTLQEIVEREVCEHFEIDRETAIVEAEELAAGLAEHSILHLSTVAKGQA
jgi:coenzyme PQQ synthesis protein D (PqqD)